MADGNKVYFTYVWGPPGDPAWPLTFANKGSRTNARRVLTEGDFVFTVCTKGEPTPEGYWGRVTGLYRVSDLEVNTLDYDLPRRLDRPEFDSISRFPFALHPIAVWEITSTANLFAELVGPLTPTHHVQAQSRIVELDAASAKPLLALDRQELQLALPRTEFGLGRVLHKNSKLAPKHQGSFTGQFANHETWFVYTLILRDSTKKWLALKVGYSHDPQARADALNASLAQEVTGLCWCVDLRQPTSTEDAAREIEQSILAQFSSHRLPSNGEMLSGVDPTTVAVAVATEMRARRVQQ